MTIFAGPFRHITRLTPCPEVTIDCYLEYLSYHGVIDDFETSEYKHQIYKLGLWVADKNSPTGQTYLIKNFQPPVVLNLNGRLGWNTRNGSVKVKDIIVGSYGEPSNYFTLGQSKRVFITEELTASDFSLRCVPSFTLKEIEVGVKTVHVAVADYEIDFVQKDSITWGKYVYVVDPMFRPQRIGETKEFENTNTTPEFMKGYFNNNPIMDVLDIAITDPISPPWIRMIKNLSIRWIDTGISLDAE